MKGCTTGWARSGAGDCSARKRALGMRRRQTAGGGTWSEAYLEWDRGTESVDRLLRKSANYIHYFVRRVAADYSHILFVFPSVTTELAYHKGLTKQLPADERCCVFWTTTVNRLEVLSPTGTDLVEGESPTATT
jgi:hypothetical protein